MKHLGKFIAIIIFMAVAATAVDAKFNKAQDAIRYRQAVMFLISQHFGSMGQVVKGNQPYNQTSFAEEAGVLEMLSKMPWDAFFYPESWPSSFKFAIIVSDVSEPRIDFLPKS